jgi:5-methylcytosine-specific restriction protein A
MSLREVLIKISSEFQKERLKTVVPKKPARIPPGNILANYIRKNVPEIITGLFKEVLKDDMIVDASPGGGNWTHVPWIAILNKFICLKSNGRISAEIGYYPVYAFSKDEKFIMFSLGQGEKNVRDSYPENVDHILETRAIFLNKKIPESRKKFTSVSKIVLDKGNINAQRWVKSSAFGMIYKTNNLPTENELRDDFIEMINLYRKAIERGGVSEGLNTQNTLDQEQDSIGYEKKIIRHINLENQIIQTDPKFIKKLKKDKNYSCEACGFRYDKIYINYSEKKDYIEAHHIEPKFKVKSNVDLDKKLQRSADDFAMLCANCHRMIHRMMKLDKDRTISLEEFKKRINSNFKDYIKKL